jgi:hypothetical protein
VLVYFSDTGETTPIEEDELAEQNGLSAVEEPL